MAIVSYGTITITDTNDIESIVVEYNRNQSTTTPPEQNDLGWSTTRPAWASGYYIWQRTRTHKSGTQATSDIIGNAVCITGATGQKGDALEISSVKYAISEENSFIDEEPYTFRSSLGGNRLRDKIVGGTIFWNQLINLQNIGNTNGITVSVDSNNIVSVSGTPTASYAAVLGVQEKGIKNHVYFIYNTLIANPNNLQFYIGAMNSSLYNRSGGTITKLGDDVNYNSFGIKGLDTTADYAGIKFISYACDLTQMFGSTIADYIYSLEQATTGAGVAWFKKLFPKPYYAYNTGELKSVSGLVSHDMTGFNQFDKSSTYDGYIDNEDGSFHQNNTSKATDYISVVGGASYYINSEQTAGGWGAWYDADKNYISGVTGYIAGSPDKVRIAPANACYIRLTVQYNNNGNADTFCINLHWDGSRDGEYEPYVLHSYPLDSDLTLRGIPKLDANNKLYYDGDEYLPSGEVTRNCAEDTITIKSIYTRQDNENYDWAVAQLSSAWSGISTNIIAEKVLSNHNLLSFTSVSIPIGTVFVYNTSTKEIAITVTKGTTKAQAENVYNGSKIVYKLATPTTETADPYTNPQIINDFGTEEYVTNSLLPVGHSTEYFTGTTDQPADSDFTYNEPPDVKDGQWLWVRTTYSDNTKVYLKTRQGVEGLPGIAGRGITDVETLYATNNSTTTAPTSGWQTQPPTYDSSKPKYWVKVTTTYDSGDPTVVTYLDNGITDAMSTAAAANSTANTANQNASTALTNANTALTNANNALSIANGTKQWFWAQATDYSTAIPAGTYVTQIGETSFKSSPSGGNVLTRSDGIYLRNGGVTLGSLTGTALTFYKPNTTNKGMELTTSALVFYNPANSSKAIELGTKNSVSTLSFYNPSNSNISMMDLTSSGLIFKTSAGAEIGKFGSDTSGGLLELSGRLNIKGGGRIGQDSDNYWEFGDNKSYDSNDSAYLIGKGTASLQLGETGHWRLDKNRIHAGWYQLNDSSSSTPMGSLHFDTGAEENTTYYWDYGMHYPDKAGGGNNKFLYIRRSNDSTSTTLGTMKGRIDDDSWWTYKFYIDGDGNIHAGDVYSNGTLISGQSAPYLLKSGGTMTGSITMSNGGKFIGDVTGNVSGSAGKLSNTAKIGDTNKPVYFTANGVPAAISYEINKSVPSNALFTDENVKSTEANTTKLWLVGSDTSGTRTGTLKYDSGVYITTTAGTVHATTFEGALSGTASRATADADGNTIKTTYLKLTGGNVTGAVTFGSSVSADELTVGDLVVNGAASFTNNLQANTINGVTVGSSPKFTDVNVTQTATTTSAAYEVLFSYTADNTTRTEGARKTSTFTYNPNTKELTVGTVKIKEASTGFTISGGTTSKTLTVGGDYTLAAAAAKGVVTSIDTSANLPTSNAVKTFVEGKGYITANHTSTYTLPLAASGTRGGVQIGYSANGKNYPVQLSSEKMYVNVPWENTTYTTGNGLRLSGTQFINTRIPFVAGTQTAATGSWTGVCNDIAALYDGLTIAYWLPYAGSGNATLNLTINGTATGAKNCYYSGTTRLTTHFGAGNIIYLTYRSAGNINGTNYEGWWANANYDSNDTGYYHRRIYPNIKAGSNKIYPYTLIMQLPDGRWESLVTSNSTGTSKAKNTHGFLLGHILLMYYNETYTENQSVSTYRIWSAYTGLIDHRYSFNTANDSTNGTTGYKPIYLVGSLGSDGLFYLADKWWTQTLPTTADGKIYIYIGDAYDYYRMTFTEDKPMYVYTNGKLREFSQDTATVTGHTVAKDVPSNAIFTDTWNALSTSQAGYVAKAPNDTGKFLRGDATWAAVTKSNVGLGNVTNDKQIKGLSSGTTSGHLVTWGSDGYTVADSGITKGNIVKSVGSNNSGQLVLTYADDTTSNPIDVTFVATIASSATLADALNVGGTAVGSATTPVYFDNQGKPQTANTIPKLNNTTTGGAFYAPTSAGTAKQILVSTAGTPGWQTVATGGTNGTIKIGSDEYAVKGLAAAAYKGIADSSSASAIGTGTSVTTERDVYYGLPTINNAHNYTSSTTIYAPTAGGTSSQVLIGNGTTSAPVWTDISGLVPSSATNATNATYATYDASEVNNTTKVAIADKYIPKSIGTAAGDIIYWSASGTPTRLAKGSNGQVLKLANGVPTWGTDNNDNTWRAIQVNGTDILGTGTNTNKLNLKAGTNVSLSNSSGTVTITATDVKVTQTNTTGNADYRLLFSENANDTDSTETTRKNTNLKFNPSSGLLKTYGISSAAGSTPVIYSDVSATEIKAADSSLTTSSSDSDWLKALLIALCTKYPDRGGCIFKGTMSPNSVGWYEVHIYNTSIKDSTTGLPQYSFGRFLKYINNYELFGTSSYAYSYRTVDTNTWNALSTSQAGYVSTAPNDTTKFLRGDATWAQVSSANLSDIRLTWSSSVSTTDWILAHDTAATGTPLFRAMSPTNLKTTMSLNNVENTKLSTWAGSSNITTVGTISSGTWNGSAIPVANGGTGATTAANARTNLGLGSAATYTAATSVGNNSNLPTGAAIQTYVTNAISGASNTYVTIATNQTITANQKTFNGAIRWGTASKYGAAHYDSTLEAIVFSFA